MSQFTHALTQATVSMGSPMDTSLQLSSNEHSGVGSGVRLHSAGNALGHVRSDGAMMVTVTSVNQRPPRTMLLRCHLLMLAAALLVGMCVGVCSVGMLMCMHI